jgi:hypothetical protein
MNAFIRAGKVRLGVSTAGLAAAAVAVVILIPGASGAASGPEAATADQAGAPLSSYFGLLRSTAEEAPPTNVAQLVPRAPADYGLQVAGIRGAKANAAWLIPGEDHLCIVVGDPDGLGMSCSPAANAEQGQLAFVEHSTGGVTTVIGVAPDGVTSASALATDGSTVTSAPVQENIYVLSGKGISEVTLSPSQGLDPIEVG